MSQQPFCLLMTIPVLRGLPADFRSFYRLFRRACSASVLQRNAESTALRNLYRTTFRRAGLIYMRAKNSAVKDGEMKEKQEVWLNLWNKRSTFGYRNRGADVEGFFFQWIIRSACSTIRLIREDLLIRSPNFLAISSIGSATVTARERTEDWSGMDNFRLIRLSINRRHRKNLVNWPEKQERRR